MFSVERLDSGAYILRVCDERGDLPELAECDAIQRVAAQQLLTEDVYGGPTDD